jgi:hypothetical protein
MAACLLQSGKALLLLRGEAGDALGTELLTREEDSNLSNTDMRDIAGLAARASAAGQPDQEQAGNQSP